MTKEIYEKISAPFRNNPANLKILLLTNKLLTNLVFCLYPLFLVWLLVSRNREVIRCILVPGITFLLVTWFRALFSAPRPYELLEIQPLMERHSVGKSFPSRHVFSIFMIAATIYTIFPIPGLILAAAGVLLAVIRVIGGVHFPKDVVAGALLGIGLGIGGWVLFLLL